MMLGAKKAQGAVATASRATRISVRAQATAKGFLQLNSSSVTIDVLDSETATVRVSAADRPGLLQDVASAISGVGLTVESGEVTTPMDSFALNTFKVKVGADGVAKGLSFDTVEDGFGEFEEEDDMVADSVLAQMLRSAILNQALANSRRALADRKANPPAQASGASVAPVVAVSQLQAADGAPFGVVVSVEAADFPGILASITAGFEAQGLTVRSAQVRTTDGVIKNRFVLNYDADKADLEAIKASTLAAVSI